MSRAIHEQDGIPYVVLEGGQIVFRPHAETEDCALGCAVHSPSDHHMAAFPQHFRGLDPFGMHPGLIERTCSHGVGHPDPDHMRWYATCHTAEETGCENVHGCCGCCTPPTEQDPS